MLCAAAMVRELAKTEEPAIFAEIANVFHLLEEALAQRRLIVSESLEEMPQTTFVVATKAMLVALDVMENHLARCMTFAEFVEEMVQLASNFVVSRIARLARSPKAARGANTQMELRLASNQEKTTQQVAF